MSRFKNKLFVFDYIITQLVEWKAKGNRTVKDVLKDLSFVPLMKCHYSLCLLSVRMQEKESLFDLFDNFRAYPKGPVEEDCYYNMNKLPNYQMGKDELGKSVLVPRQEKNPLYSSDEDVEKYIQMVNRAMSILKGAKNFPEFSDRNNLIDLTHMNLWRDAFEDRTGKQLLRTQPSNIDKVRMEARTFINLIS